MNKYLKTLLASLLVLMAAEAAQAATFSDDFQRAVTSGQTSTSDPNEIGTEYTILTGKWNISDTSSAGRVPNYLAGAQDSGTNPPPAIMYFNTFETLRTAGSSFSASMDVWNGGYSEVLNDRWQGMVFNLQDADNYYVFEYTVNAANSGTLRLGIVVDGSYSALDTKTNVNVDRSLYYTLSVEANETGITGELKTISGTSLATVSSSNTTLTDGYAGFIRDSTASVGYDNFSVTSIPEPSTMGLGLGLVVLGGALLLRRRKQ